MAQIRVLSPVGVVKAQTVAVPSLPQSWNGRTVGFLDNTKSNFDRLVGDLGAQLSALISGAAGAGTKDRATAATAAAHAGLADPATTDPITVGDDPVAILDAFTARNWADGLPIIAPTEERVSAMLGGRDGARSLGVMPPLWRQVTLEKLAVNAVMAGCEPRAFPVVAAAVDAMLDRAFNLYGVQATTHPVT